MVTKSSDNEKELMACIFSIDFVGENNISARHLCHATVAVVHMTAFLLMNKRCTITQNIHHGH